MGEDGAIPPLNILDLPPPPPNETVGDAFGDALGGLEEDNPDKGPIPVETEIPVKMAKRPCTKSPIKEVDCSTCSFSHCRSSQLIE